MFAYNNSPLLSMPVPRSPGHSHSDSDETTAHFSDLEESKSRAFECDSEVTVHHLNILRTALKVKVPYTGGVYPVKAEDLALYYDTDGERNARKIDLGNATPGHLTELASACQKATFGVNQTDVLDESYRKAGKMDLTKFAARLDIVASGLLETISPDILDGQNFNNEQVLRAEMYKLNVYGPGGHFKGHKDTPRGEDMIGSLVVIFPTVHKGGALTLSHDDKNWIFDSAGELAMRTSSAGPAIAYVAFYSDVTHAVEPVLEGHRVTLTYNLFLVDRPLAAHLPTAAPRILQGPAQLLEDTLFALLADPAFLPTGGLLAFGLTHQYPMPSLPPPNKPRPNALALGPVLRLLKGSDARLRTAAQRVGLATHVKILYDSGEHDWDGDGIGHDILAEDVLNMENVSEEYGDLTREIDRRGALLQRGEQRMQDIEAIDEKKRGFTRSRRYWYESGGAQLEGAIPVHWVTRITELNRVRSQYVAFGNESTLSHMYGNAALFVEVPGLGEGVRSTE